ncbi:MAG: hypothetical protein ACF8AM_20845 [Rhodopirellula sp. JB055]|uniref:hypothetical protein n=1 Tax=Rhodopirellula sp. JB055 TaxID=3342846 RepID=UPI00370ADD6C
MKFRFITAKAARLVRANAETIISKINRKIASFVSKLIKAIETLLSAMVVLENSGWSAGFRSDQIKDVKKRLGRSA